MAILQLAVVTFLIVFIYTTQSCEPPTEVKAALVNGGRRIELTWKPPTSGPTVQIYFLYINSQPVTVTEPKYLIQNPLKQFNTFSVGTRCTGNQDSKQVTVKIGFVGEAVFATVGQQTVNIRWRTTATINNTIDIKNKDKDINLFILRRSNVPYNYSVPQYNGRIVYNGDLAIGVISFTLSNVTSQDAGYYMSDVGTTDTGGQVLVVLDEPTKPTIQYYNSYVGKPLELICNSEKRSLPKYYTPELNYTWFINDSIHVYDTRHRDRYRQIQNKLIVDNITKQDKGHRFACKASDRGHQSEQSHIITLNPFFGPETVILAPEIKTHNVIFGNKFGPINCSAECNPTCTFNWKFRKTGNTAERETIGNSNVLTIHQVARANDGEYRCIASSQDTNVIPQKGTKTINLNVQFQAEIKNITYSVNAGSTMAARTPVTVSENDDVNLQCNIEANPKATISWNYDGKLLNQIASAESLVYNLGQAISCENSGVYSCVADNRIVSSVNKSIHLYVQCKPKQNMRSPVRNIYGSRLNSAVNVSLSIIAHPKPTHRWTTNATAIIREKQTSEINLYSFKYEGSVTIQKATDFGKYCLELTNDKGSSKICLQIQAEDNPKAPTNFTVENILPEMINLTWISEFNGGREQTFYIEYREKNGNSGFTKINISDVGAGKQMRASVMDLKANVVYLFQLYSRNGLGNSTVQELEVRTTAFPSKEPVTSNLTSIIAGVIAAIFLAFIIVIVLIVLIRRNSSKNIKTGKSKPPDGPITSSDVVYSAVNKPKKKNQKLKNELDVNVLYSEVKKSDKNDNAYKDEGNLYENSALLDNGEASGSNAFDDTMANKEGANGRHTNEDGLIYVDVDVGGKKEDKKKGEQIIHGEEDRTEYTSIDFTRKEPPVVQD